MAQAGYSKRSLTEKLGLKAGAIFAILEEPAGYRDLLELLDDVLEKELTEKSHDFIQYFTTEPTKLTDDFDRLKKALRPEGMLWVSWPKMTSQIKTDLNENIIRELGLKAGLVDVKVIAVDENWSGLKFVYRLKDR